MKNLIPSFVFLVVFGIISSSCNTKEETPTIVSKWHLIEMLADPGDGSGQFQPVTSDKIVEFFEDGTITSNGSICIMGTENTSGSTGTYDSTTMTIDVDDCTGGHVPLSYEMDGSYLILNYACIEPCREKYEQVQ
jgi:hypothetical protein